MESLEGARIVDVAKVPANSKMLVLLEEHLRPGMLEILSMKEKLSEQFPGVEWTIMCGVHELVAVVPSGEADDKA